MKSYIKKTIVKTTPKKSAKQQVSADPAKELAKAQRKIKRLQKQADMYFAWFNGERIERNKAVQACNESQLVAKLYKERSDEYYNKYTKILEERIEESKKKIQQTWEEINKKLAPAKTEPNVQDAKADKAPQNTLRILCIETGPIDYEYYDGEKLTHTADPEEGWRLEFCEVYTTPGPVVDEWGCITYPINQFNGYKMLAQRFAVLQETA